MAITLEKQTASPNMVIMITVSLVVHLFIFLHIEEIYRLKQHFKKPELPIKIEVMLQEIPKSAPIASAPLAAVLEPIPVIPPPPITEDSRISQPIIPMPELVKEKKKEIIRKIVKKKEIVKDQIKPLQRIQEPKIIRESSPEVSALKQAPPLRNLPQISVPQPLLKPPSTSQSDKLLAKAYFNSMRLMIEKNKRYPQMARRRNQEGSVRVRFVIDKNGNVNSLEIVKGVDYESLNKAALEAVRRAAPFAKPPASISRDALKLELTINFTLI